MTKRFIDRSNTITQFSNLADEVDYPNMPKALHLNWRLFCRDYQSKDKEVTKEINELCHFYKGYKVDFRPYLIENPTSVLSTDNLENCVDLFRTMHLRHLLVLDPESAKLRGIITRQDLFRWLDL